MRARTVVFTVLSALTNPSESAKPAAPPDTLAATASPLVSTSVSSSALTVSLPAWASTSAPASTSACVVLATCTQASEPAAPAEIEPAAPEIAMPTAMASVVTWPSETALTVMSPVVASTSEPLMRAVVVGL